MLTTALAKPMELLREMLPATHVVGATEMVLPLLRAMPRQLLREASSCEANESVRLFCESVL